MSTPNRIQLNEIYKKRYNETRANLEKHYARSNFHPDERESLSHYTGFGHAPLNEHLWRPEETDKEDAPHLDNDIVKLDKALKKHVTPHDLMVYTGTKKPPTNLRTLGATKTGHMHIQMPGYTSTSLSPQMASDFSEHSGNALIFDHEGKQTDAKTVIARYNLHSHVKKEFNKNPIGFVDSMSKHAKMVHDYSIGFNQIQKEYEDEKRTHLGHIKKLKAAHKKPFLMLSSTHKKLLRAAEDHTNDGNEFGELMYKHNNLPAHYSDTLHQIRYHANVIFHSKPTEDHFFYTKYPFLKDERTRTELAQHSVVDKHVLRIHIPAGSHGTYVDHMSENKGEHEFLLPRNSRFHIDPTPRINKKLGAFVWKAKLVHDGTKPVG